MTYFAPSKIQLTEGGSYSKNTYYKKYGGEFYLHSSSQLLIPHIKQTILYDKFYVFSYFILK